MATIGLSKPYYAVYNYNGSGQPTYSNGGVLGKATEMSLSLDAGDANILYADNGPAESDNQFTGGSYSITTDDLLPEPMLGVLGLVAELMDIEGVSTPNAQWMIFDDRQAIPYVGFGGVIKKRQSGATKWVAFVLTKIQFQNPGVDAVTQGETIEWQTPTLEGTVMRDDGPNHRWFMMSTPLDTEADAEAAVKSILGISDTPTLETLTVVSTAGSSSGKTTIKVSPVLAYGNHYVYQVNTSVDLPTAGEDVSSGWTAWDGVSEITATSGQEIAVVEADSNNKAVGAGKTTVTANAEG